MRFTEFEINEHLLKALSALGYEETTPVQTQAILPGLQGRDIVASAQTGTGKTLAFLVPALERLLREETKTKHPRVVVLVPTRELAIQVAGEAKKLAKHTRLRTVAVYGGAAMKKQIDGLRRGVDIVVATPGRLLDHMRRKNVQFTDLQVLVLDEADRMLDMGFLPDIKQIVERMPRQRQTMLFSATIPPQISALARQFQRDPVRIEVDLDQPPESIQQALYPVPRHLKMQLLLAMLQQTEAERLLVFTRTKREADRVAQQLDQANLDVACIHGDHRQRERINALEGFRSGRHRVLVATNVAARGLDVEGISHVINFDVPEHADEYVHRVGRTARADADGDAITLVTPDEEPLVYRIEYRLGRKLARETVPGFDYDVPAPTWAQPSAKTLMRQTRQKQSVRDRWRSMI
jgi:ATP-dependent RNA helicase RhlE